MTSLQPSEVTSLQSGEVVTSPLFGNVTSLQYSDLTSAMHVTTEHAAHWTQKPDSVSSQSYNDVTGDNGGLSTTDDLIQSETNDYYSETNTTKLDHASSLANFDTKITSFIDFIFTPGLDIFSAVNASNSISPDFPSQLPPLRTSQWQSNLYSQSNWTYEGRTPLPHAPPPPAALTATDAAVAAVLSLLILAIIVGNTLVIVSVACFSKMRTLSNGLIASLASADLLVALVVLPLSLHHELTGPGWGLGPRLCDLWVTSDVFCCTASILNIVVIAVDRYWLITRHVRYTHSALLPRRRVCLLLLLLAWALAALISCLPLLGWPPADPPHPGMTSHPGLTPDHAPSEARSSAHSEAASPAPSRTSGHAQSEILHTGHTEAISPTHSEAVSPSPNWAASTAPDPQCAISQDYAFTVFSTFGAFWLPLIVILVVYFKIFFFARQRALRRALPPRGGAAGGAAGGDKSVSTVDTLFHPSTTLGASLPPLTRLVPPAVSAQFLQPPLAPRTRQPSRSLSTGGASTASSARGSRERSLSAAWSTTSSRGGGRERSDSDVSPTESSAPPAHHYRTAPPLPEDPRARSRKSRSRRMRRSARMLGLIIGGFLVCWMPFFVVATLAPFCAASCAPPSAAASFVTWLGYSNSLFNPAIYAIWDKAFRRAFRRLCTCDWRSAAQR